MKFLSLSLLCLSAFFFQADSLQVNTNSRFLQSKRKITFVRQFIDINQQYNVNSNGGNPLYLLNPSLTCLQKCPINHVCVKAECTKLPTKFLLQNIPPSEKLCISSLFSAS